jgi:Flp pilus assembly protein TadG
MKFAQKAIRGQTLVEFALILPIFLSMLFGIIEFAFISGSIAYYHSLVAKAIRAETLAGSRNGSIDHEVSQFIGTNTQVFAMTRITSIEIYQSNAQGRGPQSTSKNVYDESGNLIGSVRWPVETRISTTTSPIYVGIRVTYSYTWLSSFIGALGAPLTLIVNDVAPINFT